MTLIYDRPQAGAAAHALVIGVGAYAHLPGGRGPHMFPDHQGLGQLSSPPHSARRFASWLMDGYRNSECPLASIDLLVSDDFDDQFALPGDGGSVSVERAVFANAAAAIRQRWYARGDENPDNLLIFYFCGHGVSRGLITSLLLEDFGSFAANPLDEAIDFREFYAGMDRCAARRQVYFIDSCRAASAALIENYNFYTGQPVIPGSAFHSPLGVRYAPVYYAAVPGTLAYGRTGQASVFTAALLKAFAGAGSEEYDGLWRVDTDTLNRGIEALMRRMLRNTPGMQQVASVDGLQKFPLHMLDGAPLVPVTLGCKPERALPHARLGYAPEGEVNRVVRDPEAAEWEVELEAGDYEFFVEFKGAGFENKTVCRPVYPPERVIHMEVEP